jgi:hypothetical protein
MRIHIRAADAGFQPAADGMPDVVSVERPVTLPSRTMDPAAEFPHPA